MNEAAPLVTAGPVAIFAAHPRNRAPRGRGLSLPAGLGEPVPDVKNEAVQRAIRIQLVHLYQQSGQSEKAVEQLDSLIKGAPAGAGTTGEGQNR